MSDLMDFLRQEDLGIERSGDELHIGVAAAEHLLSAAEIFEIGVPEYLSAAALQAGAVSATTVAAGVALSWAGPLLGMTGVFMALGSGYDEAREEIRAEETQSGFSQGFVAGILRMSGTTVSSLFGKHGVVHVNDFDPDADTIATNAYNKGLVAGYALAGLADDERKKAFVLEIREYTGHVDAGDWGDREKVDYVVAYAAQLRLHWLNELVAGDD